MPRFYAHFCGALILVALAGFLVASSCGEAASQTGGEAASDLASRIAADPAKVQLAPGQKAGALVTFPAGSRGLSGFLYVPDGPGPFPAVVWNHGSEKLPGAQPELAAFYNRQGFVFFLPHRAGQGRSPGEYIGHKTDELHRALGNSTAFRTAVVGLHEAANDDVAAAVAWLKTQPEIDPARIVMSGVSYGGIQTLLSAEKGLGVGAFIAFAPGAESWANGELRARLAAAVRDARAPLFIVQASNDFSTGPYEVLGALASAKGGINRAKLYPAFGVTHEQGHFGFATWDIGTGIWGADVMDFIHAAWRGKHD